MKGEQHPLLKNFRAVHGRIGVFGGTFDPVHNGHLEAAKRAKAQHALDAVVFIPARRNPYKPNSPIANDEQRVRMLTRALRNEQGMFVSEIETKRGGASYTIDTIRQIKSELDSNSRLYMIMGADCLSHFHYWEGSEEILELATLIPVSRPHSENNLQGPAIPACVREIMRGNTVQLEMHLSSSGVREQLAKGVIPHRELPAGLHDSVRVYLPQGGVAATDALWEM